MTLNFDGSLQLGRPEKTGVIDELIALENVGYSLQLKNNAVRMT